MPTFGGMTKAKRNRREMLMLNEVWPKKRFILLAVAIFLSPAVRTGYLRL